MAMAAAGQNEVISRHGLLKSLEAVPFFTDRPP